MGERKPSIYSFIEAGKEVRGWVASQGMYIARDYSPKVQSKLVGHECHAVTG